MVTSYIWISRSSFSWLHITLLRDCFQPISYGVVLFVFVLMSLGHGSHSLVLEHLSLDKS